MGLFDDLKESAGRAARSGESEKVTGDVVTTSGGSAVSDSPLTMDEITKRVPTWLAEWQDLRGIDDIKKVPPLIFRDGCRYIGEKYIKPSRVLKDTRTRICAGGRPNTCNAYNPASVAALYEVFKAVCDMCNKTPYESTFSAFSGVSMDWLGENNGLLTSVGFGLAKRIQRDKLDAIEQNASNDTVGRIAILNNEKWNNGGMASGSASVVVVDSIPTAAGFKAIEQKTLD